ncbi:cytochrome d ubiquinol oxidase subunit II [Wohlfahrtiimonas larvae]|uniref:Cytochrome d ubiquinol oxidase subunit II n=2 Tax=Wohlfahrtiimonas larvae TaxID=1157986 RepID=A0ABP9MVU2_9GAMM
MEYNTLVIAWTGIILLGVAIYVILDGFDLGVGMLYPFVSTERDRTLIMNSVGPVWDGNETWLILGGASLFAIFPIAYSVVLSGLYIPIVLLLISLIFRGISFEFRHSAEASKRYIWNRTFFLGSVFTGFFQGIIVGALIQGFDFIPAAEAVNAPVGYVSKGALDLVMGGNSMSWLSPFTIVTGISLTIFYALLGSTWLIKKTEGQLQSQIRQIAKKIAIMFFVLATMILIWTIIMWRTELFAAENVWKLYIFAMAYILAIGVSFILMKSIHKGSTHWQPFMYTLLLTVLGAIGLIAFLLPYIVPFQVTVFQAASAYSAMSFAFIGAVIFIPVVLVYTGYIYYVFRGKVQEEEIY